MRSKLSRLKESFGDATVMMNVVDPVSKYYCEKDILREEDEPIFKHLEACMGLTPERGVGIINSFVPDYKPAMEGELFSKWMNDLCRILCTSAKLDTQDDDIKIIIENESEEQVLKGGMEYLVSENPNLVPIFEAVDTDNLADKVLSNDEVLLLMQLAQPNKHRDYNPSQREIIKKQLKDKNSSVYRVLSGNYLKETEEVPQSEAIAEVGVEAIVEAQKKSFSLTECGNSLAMCAVGSNGYKIIKLKV